MPSDQVYLKSLLASAKNLIGVIRNKQWERLDSKADCLEMSVNLARAALESAGQVRGDGWLPIESAPKDKTLFLAATADGRIMIFSGMILDIAMGKRTPNHLQFPATHWQPLPASPEPTKE